MQFVFKPGVRWLQHAWFLRIVSVRTSVYVCVCVCMCACVCLLPRLLIIIGMIWTPYDWLNKFYSFYMPLVVTINDGRGLTVKAHRLN